MFGDWLQLQLLRAGVESVPVMVLCGLFAFGFLAGWVRTKEKFFRNFFLIFALAFLWTGVTFWAGVTYYEGYVGGLR
jgi:hypothetical protein